MYSLILSRPPISDSGIGWEISINPVFLIDCNFSLSMIALSNPLVSTIDLMKALRASTDVSPTELRITSSLISILTGLSFSACVFAHPAILIISSASGSGRSMTVMSFVSSMGMSMTGERNTMCFCPSSRMGIRFLIVRNTAWSLIHLWKSLTNRTLYSGSASILSMTAFPVESFTVTNAGSRTRLSAFSGSGRGFVSPLL